MTPTLTTTNSRAMVVVLIAFSLIAAGVLLIPVRPASAVTYTISVQTDKTLYSGTQTITIFGFITPAPGPNTATTIVVKNPGGSTVDPSSNEVNATTGAYSHSWVAGGTPNWVAGNFTVTAIWGGSGTTITATTSFHYSPTSTTTTTTTTTTITSTSSTTTTTTTTSTSTKTSTTTSSSTVPDFDSTSLLFVSLVTLSAVAVLARTRLSVTRNP